MFIPTKHAWLMGLAVVGQVVGCGQAATFPDGAPDAELGPDGQPFEYPAPVDDLVPAIGSEATIEIATWNLENFPAIGETPAIVADLITSLQLDIIVFEEIASNAAFAELVARLRTYDAVLSRHQYTPTDYQKIAVLVRRDVGTITADELLFIQDNDAFPRPPLRVDVTLGATTLGLIGLHLKAGVSADDAQRRTAAFVALDQYVGNALATGGEDQLVILGDYNEVADTVVGETVLAPLRDQPDRYTLWSEPLADGGGVSFLPADIMLDHITTTAALSGPLAGATAQIPPLNLQLPSYQTRVSDHLPVVLIAPRAGF